MGAAAARLADVAIFTNDNPRSEDPLAILGEMLAGALAVPPAARAHVIVEPDRGAAIGIAIAGAGKGDVVLIAGKGHERGQYVAGKVIPFDDREAAAGALADRSTARQRHDQLRRTSDPADRWSSSLTLAGAEPDLIADLGAIVDGAGGHRLAPGGGRQAVRRAAGRAGGRARVRRCGGSGGRGGRARLAADGDPR